MFVTNENTGIILQLCKQISHSINLYLYLVIVLDQPVSLGTVAYSYPLFLSYGGGYFGLQTLPLSSFKVKRRICKIISNRYPVSACSCLHSRYVVPNNSNQRYPIMAACIIFMVYRGIKLDLD